MQLAALIRTFGHAHTEVWPGSSGKVQDLCESPLARTTSVRLESLTPPENKEGPCDS